ncbi:MAG: CPBP family intramembrane glutamic endopeptidase [Candidatus Sulfotelmatobacter sp.]
MSAVIGLTLVFAWPCLLLGQSHSLANVHDDILTIMKEWAVAIALGVIVFGVQKRKPSDVGLIRLGRRELIGILCALVASCIFVNSRFISMPPSSPGVSGMIFVPFAMKLGLVVTAGVCEEFIFRGFGIEELASLTGSVWFAGLVTWLGFSIAHVASYGLTPALVFPAILGAFLTLLYLWRRNLTYCIFLHAILDGVSLFLGPAIMKSH